MNELISSIGFGILGGVARVLIDFLRTYQSGEKINFKRMWIYFFIVIVAGAFSGIVLDFGKTLSFLGGYAGLDLINGYYRTFKNKKIKIK